MTRRRPYEINPRSNIRNLRTRRDGGIYDWQADEDGPLTDLDIRLILASLDAAPQQAVRDAARKLRRHFDGVHA